MWCLVISSHSRLLFSSHIWQQQPHYIVQLCTSNTFTNSWDPFLPAIFWSTTNVKLQVLIIFGRTLLVANLEICIKRICYFTTSNRLFDLHLAVQRQHWVNDGGRFCCVVGRLVRCRSALWSVLPNPSRVGQKYIISQATYELRYSMRLCVIKIYDIAWLLFDELFTNSNQLNFTLDQKIPAGRFII